MFLVYVNDLPDGIEDGEVFGYADEFKVVTTSSSNAEKAALQIEKWSVEKKMILNVDKINILCIKGETQTNGRLKTVTSQKDLGVIMSNSLSWSENCSRRTLKGGRTLYCLIRNTSKHVSLETKLNADAGYVVPVLTYASQVWYPSKTELRKIEQVHRKATK